MRNCFYIIPFFFVLMFLFGCDEKQLTPEEVAIQYETYMAEGECEKAKELCTEEGKIMVQASIDAGCPKSGVKIDSISCEITGDDALCNCRYIIQGASFLPGKFNSQIALKRIEGEWKIHPYLLPDLPTE